MVYGAKRNPDRCPTHPGALLREEVIPATGKSKAEIARLLGISRQHLYDVLRERKPVSPSVAVRLGKIVWRRRRGLGTHAGDLRYLARGTRRECERHSHASSQSRISASAVVTPQRRQA
jgi:antitoxin HigA-1